MQNSTKILNYRENKTKKIIKSVRVSESNNDGKNGAIYLSSCKSLVSNYYSCYNQC